MKDAQPKMGGKHNLRNKDTKEKIEAQDSDLAEGGIHNLRNKDTKEKN